jgi:hypothetical protein
VSDCDATLSVEVTITRATMVDQSKQSVFPAVCLSTPLLYNVLPIWRKVPNCHHRNNISAGTSCRRRAGKSFLDMSLPPMEVALSRLHYVATQRTPKYDRVTCVLHAGVLH